MDRLENLIKREEDRSEKILQEAKELRLQESFRREEFREFEIKKWEEFKKVVENEDYFRIDHINKIGVDFDICIHLSAKGAGKTTELFRMMSRVLNKGEKFMYGRVYKNELDTEMVEFNDRDDCPVYSVSWKNCYYFFEKKKVNEWLSIQKEVSEDDGVNLIPSYAKLIKSGLKCVGKSYTFLASNSLSGGKYENYTTVLFDEILSYSPINRISDRILKAWGASVSTIQRNKPGIKIYMFGNLQDVPSHPILSFYGIDINDNLRIIKRGKESETTILYINSGGLYKNTIGHKGGSVHHTTPEHQIFLKYNQVIKPTTKILNAEIFGNMDSHNAFALMCGEPYYVQVKKCTFSVHKKIFAIRCNRLELSTIIDGNIYADNADILNLCSNTIYSPCVDAMMESVYSIYENRNLYFDCYESLKNWQMCVDYNTEYINNIRQEPLTKFQ